MKAIMLMFDSLNRHMLPNYGCDWVKAANFERLAEKTVTFNNCYAGSLPCMPARRELHTGRYNFLHRSWGSLEPFDDSMPELLKKNGVYTHLVSDHFHYWEDGGATYHSRYNSWEFSRGQQGDPWKGHVKEPDIPECENPRKISLDNWKQDWVNREYMNSEDKQPMAKSFNKGLEFIETNCEEDNWFLQLETFDPHEPFFTQQKYKDLYPHDYKGKHFDWINYNVVTESKEAVEHMRYEYAALVSMCDEYLGKVLDMMDKNNMWEDTMLIVNTDHGLLLGEREWWGKNIQPYYNEIAQIPFFVWDPRSKVKNERRNALVQTIDIAPTLLDLFGVEIPKDMEGKPLKETVESDKKIRDAALFGVFGAQVNCTDSRYIYMRGPVSRQNDPLFEYTLMPTRMRSMYSVDDLSDIQLQEPFDFTKSCRVIKTKAKAWVSPFNFGSPLYDLENDPMQENPIENFEVEQKMIEYMAALMKKNDAPQEQFERLGIPKNGKITIDELKKQREARQKANEVDLGVDVEWEESAKLIYWAIMRMMPKQRVMSMQQGLVNLVKKSNIQVITEKSILGFAKNIFPPDKFSILSGFLKNATRTR